MPDDLLKIPVRLTKLNSKTGQDHENMWVIQFETHETQAESIASLIPFVNRASFVMMLVPVNDAVEVKKAMEGEIELEEEGNCQKPAKKAVKKRKQSKRAR